MSFKSCKNKIIRLFKRSQEFILYCCIGVISASLDFTIFTSLINIFSVNYLIANMISVNCGIINSFLFNRRFNFKVVDRPLKRFLSFYTIGLTGLGISLTLLWLFVERFGVKIILSKLIVIFIVTIFQFTLNKLITFKKK